MEGMNTKSIIMSIISIVIAIMIFTGIVVPVLEDATATSDDITNAGYYKVTKLESTDDGTVTIQWDKATMPNYVLVNDEKVTITFPPREYGLSLIFGDDWDFRVYATVEGDSFGSVQFYRTTGGTNTATAYTLTFTEGAYTLKYTVSGTEQTQTGTYDAVYYPSNDGTYVMKKMDSSAHVFADTEIYAFGLTSIYGSDGVTGRPNVGYALSGTIEDGFTVSNWRVNSLAGDTLTHSDPVADYTESTKWVDVLDLSKITFTTTATQDDNSFDNEVIYSYFLVPAEITADRLDPMPASQSAILMVIPILIVLGILLMAVGMFLRNRAGTR